MTDAYQAVSAFKEYHFAACHQLKLEPPDHKCNSLHGHNYIVRVEVRGVIDYAKGGVVILFEDIDKAVDPIIDYLDHSDLREHFGLFGTAESIAVYIYAKLVSALAPMPIRVTVNETPKAGASVGAW